MNSFEICSKGPSKEFLGLREQIINWNRVLKAYEGDAGYNLAEVRKNAKKLAFSIPDNDCGEQLKVCDSTLEWIKREGFSDTKILYVHGGGFIAGSLDNHRPFARELSKRLNADILMVGYPLAPESPFPVAFLNCVEAYRYFAGCFEDKKNRLGIIGDSAGANLALSAMLKLRDEKFSRLPDFAVFMSGFFDLSLKSRSLFEKKDDDIVLSLDFLELCTKYYLKEKNPGNKYISPVNADFKGLGKLLFQVGSNELLLDDSIRCHKKALLSGVESKLSIWPEMIHSFQSYYRCIPEANRAITEINEFLLSL